MSIWDSPITQGYGPTEEQLDGPYNGYAHFNKGIDLGAPVGTPIDSNVAGKVVAVSTDPNHSSGWGKFVWVQAADGTIHQWGHMDNVAVKVGDTIAQGQVVGTSGNTGKSTGPHVSYDVQKDGQYIDPSPWVGGTSGGTNMTQPRGRNYSDPELDSTYEGLKHSWLQAQSAWIRGGRPQDGDLFNAYNEAFADLADFTDQFGHPKSTANDVDPAQQEFENRIKAGDFEGRQADRAFQQWYDKYITANNQAQGEIEQQRQHNIDNVNLQDARNTSQTPGLLPRVTDAGYTERPYKDVMQEYMGRLGISDTPPPPGGGVPLPGSGDVPGQAPPEAVAGAGGAQPSPVRPAKLNLGGQLIRANANGFPLWLGQDLKVQDEFPNPSLGALGIAGKQAAPGGSGPNGRLDSYLGRAITDIAGRGVLGEDDRLFGIPGTSSKNFGKGAKKVKKWWQRAFAEGGRNIPGGPGFVGERGPEIMEVPGFGSKIVGQGGPEEVMIPEGANIMPLDEAYMFHQIKGAAKQGRAFDRMKQQQAAQARANDPQIKEKVMASLQKAMASNLIANPPYTPTLEPGVKDHWAPYRQITGIPASAEEAAMQQQAAAKGARR